MGVADFDTKVAVVVRDDLETWQRLNVTAFLMSGVVGMILERTVIRMSDRVASRLRRAGTGARTVTLKVRYGDFRTVTRSHTLARSTDLTGDLTRTALTTRATSSLRRPRPSAPRARHPPLRRIFESILRMKEARSFRSDYFDERFANPESEKGAVEGRIVAVEKQNNGG